MTQGVELPISESTRVAVILNAGSGTQKPRMAAERLRSLLQDRGVKESTHLVQGKDLCARTRAVIDQGAEIVIAGGGDGTLSAVASVLAGTRCVMGVIPLGTFNYFARSVGIPLGLEKAAQACLGGSVRSVAVGKINGRLFLNNTSLGLYPEVLDVREEVYRRCGRSQVNAYLSVLLTMLRRHSHLKAQIAIEGRKEQIRTPLIFAANNGFQVASLQLEGSRCIEDGRMSYYIVPSVGRMGLLRLAWRMVRHSLDPQKDFRMICGDEMTITTKRRSLMVACDGENERMHSPFTLGLHRNALRVIVPNALTDEKG